MYLILRWSPRITDTIDFNFEKNVNPLYLFILLNRVYVIYFLFPPISLSYFLL